MPPKARPKRTASSSDRPSNGNDAREQKKTRFASPGEDPADFEEQVDAGLEDRATRRGRVKTEGYESDSSDDGEGVVESRKKKAKEDDDMFAMGDEPEKEEEESGKKKEEKYLNLGDIEGQEFNDADGGEGDEESSESEDEPVDEDESERRAKAGMGFELSSFNMREEMEEGKFSEDGTFVRSYDPHAMHDRWMEGTNEREMKKARRAKRQRDKAEKERLQKEQADARAHGSKVDIEKELIAFLKKGETVLEALARLGERAKRAKQKEKGKMKANNKSKAAESMDVDGTHSKSSKTDIIHSAPAPQRSQIDEVTHLASLLMAEGEIDIYEKTYEHLLRSIRSLGDVEPDWVPPSADVKFEYKWDVPGATTDGEIFGPFGEEEMKAWHNAKYFGEFGEKVKVRVVGGDWGDWDDVVEE